MVLDYYFVLTQLQLVSSHQSFAQYQAKCLPSKGLSEVTGIVELTMFKNTVKLKRIVTPETESYQEERSTSVILNANLKDAPSYFSVIHLSAWHWALKEPV